jgi:hypothetical protein
MAMEPGQRPQGCQRCDGNDAQAVPGHLSWFQHRDDTSAATVTRASDVVSIDMATMPKRRWQRRQPDDYNDASAMTAMMATAPGGRPQWQCNACILHDDFATMGDFAEDGSFAEEGNFTAEGNVTKGGWLCQAK